MNHVRVFSELGHGLLSRAVAVALSPTTRPCCEATLDPASGGGIAALGSAIRRWRDEVFHRQLRMFVCAFLRRRWAGVRGRPVVPFFNALEAPRKHFACAC